MDRGIERSISFQRKIKNIDPDSVEKEVYKLE